MVGYSGYKVSIETGTCSEIKNWDPLCNLPVDLWLLMVTGVYAWFYEIISVTLPFLCFIYLLTTPSYSIFNVSFKSGKCLVPFLTILTFSKTRLQEAGQFLIMKQ